MSKTLIGITAFGGLPFLKLAIRSIRETATVPVDICVIVAKPWDFEMVGWLEEEWKERHNPISFIKHAENMGFPASVNDLYNAAFLPTAFSHGEYDNLIIIGNDVVVLPGAIDAMIHTADTTEYEMVCGSEFDVRFLVNNYPEARQYFQGDGLVFTDFNARPWELHTERRSGIQPHARKDIRNFTLFKRSAFEKVGYADVNYWPNGYYEDNQYCERCDQLQVSCCGLLDAPFFHFWSRTIKQNENRPHGTYFDRNGAHHEQWKKNPVWKIESRDGEAERIKYWSNL